jgi:hypothetical protein
MDLTAALSPPVDHDSIGSDHLHPKFLASQRTGQGATVNETL